MPASEKQLSYSLTLQIKEDKQLYTRNNHENMILGYLTTESF